MKYLILTISFIGILFSYNVAHADKKNIYIVGGGDQAVTIKKNHQNIIILPKDGGKFRTDKFDPPDDRFKAPDESKYKLPDRHKAPEGYKLPDFFIEKE